MAENRRRVVIDTNVLVEAMIAELVPEKASEDERISGHVLQHALSHAELCLSQKTMLEFARVAMDFRGATHMPPSLTSARTLYVADLQRRLSPYIPGRSKLFCRDPKDQMFLDLAQGIGASCIVTRDNDILILRQEGRCRFMRPEGYVEQFMSPTRSPVARPFRFT